MNLSRIFKVQYGINTHRPIDHEYLWRGANVETCFLPSCKRSTQEMADAIDSQDLSTAKARLFSGSQEWIKKASIKSILDCHHWIRPSDGFQNERDLLADTNDRKWTSFFDIKSNEILISLCFRRNFPFFFSDQKSEVSTFRRHFPVDSGPWRFAKAQMWIVFTAQWLLRWSTQLLPMILDRVAAA